MLDKLPPIVRHFLLLGMSWVVTNGTHAVAHLHLTQAQASAAGVGLTLAIAVFTPITHQYGVGKDQASTVNTGNASPAAK